MRTLSRDAKQLRIPSLSPGLRDRVLGGLALGESAIVPVADPVAPGWPWRRLVWAGVGAIVIIGGVRLMFNNPLYSEMSSLEFTPSHPSAGEEITVTYHASGRLSSESTLRLRAEYQRPGDRDPGYGVPRINTMLLKRGSDRTYMARLRLPANVVYARFAVEDDAGDFVDHDGPMGWELLVYANGNPTFEALRQQLREAVGRDEWEALKAAREATRLFPDRVEAWANRSYIERRVYGPDVFDSLRVDHVQQLRAFDHQLSQRSVTPDELAAMEIYALDLEVRDVEARWHGRLLREAPRSGSGVSVRAGDIMTQEGTRPRERLRLLDSLYDDVGAVRAPVLTDAGFRLAHEIGDPDEGLRWAQRTVAIEPWLRTYEASQLLSFPSLRDTALAWVDGEIEQLGRRDDSSRPLFMTRPRYRQSLDSTRLDLFGLKGQALLAVGDTLKARAYLDSAVAQGWNLDRFKAAAEARLAAGDTLGAAQLLARIAVDPAGNDEDADREGGRLLDRPAWEVKRRDAWIDMVRETRRQAEPRNLFDSVRVTRRTGQTMETVDLRDMLQGHVTVVAFWYPCSSRACLARLTDLSALVAGLPGAPQLTIVSQRGLKQADWDRLDDADVAHLVTVDAKGDAVRAFSVWSTEDTFVTDTRGEIRYQYVSLDDLARYVTVLGLAQDAVAERNRPDARGETAEQH
jgi:hypothetical protein